MDVCAGMFVYEYSSSVVVTVFMFHSQVNDLQVNGERVVCSSSACDGEMGGHHRPPSAGALRDDGDRNGADQPSGRPTHSRFVLAFRL